MAHVVHACMKNSDRFEHCENALLYSFFSLFVFVYFALYFDLYFDLFFFFMLRVSNEIQEFQVEILFEHFFWRQRRPATATAESASVLLLAADVLRQSWENFCTALKVS